MFRLDRQRCQVDLMKSCTQALGATTFRPTQPSGMLMPDSLRATEPCGQPGWILRAFSWQTSPSSRAQGFRGSNLSIRYTNAATSSILA
jgi:hypothetical protein